VNLHSSRDFQQREENFQCFDAKIVEMKMKTMRKTMKMKAKKGIIFIVFLNLGQKGLISFHKTERKYELDLFFCSNSLSSSCVILLKYVVSTML